MKGMVIMKIGFIGLGIMGEAMAINVVKKHDDTVYVSDLNEARMKHLEEFGAIAVKDNREIAEKCDVIISMVARTEHAQALYDYLLPAIKPGTTCIDMGTIDPAASRENAAKVRGKGAEFIDAPVVKSRPAAESGTLGIYVGGPEEAYEKMKPILSYMGSNIIRMGDNGAGLVMKICHNTLVAQIQNGVNETVTLAAANGIDIMTYAQAISYGGGQNFYLDSKKAVIAAEDFTAAFSIENEHKDLGLCMKLAEDCNVNMPGAKNAKRVYDEAMKAGLASEDFSATIKIVRAK